VQALLLADGLRTTMAGLCVGLAAAVPAARWAQRVIPGGAAIDVSSVAIAGAVTLLVAAGACWIPAHRASRLDPTVVLRADP
jgi:ABC-type lipoprotein release transport system permease subunit